ncbi:MAG TPA: RNA polymerase sigma factor [Candidatus Limnocylindrales bacterium]
MDRYLVQRAISGDRDAYTELVRQSIDRSYALASLVLRDPEWARDATQEAYVTAWRDLSSLRDPDRFDAWIRRIVVRSCYRESSHERRRRHVDVHQLSLVGAIADSSVQLAHRDELERGFRRLDPDLRTVLVLRHYMDLSLAEVAESLGVPIGTAKSRLNRATKAMRANLDADARSSLLPEGPLA